MSIVTQALSAITGPLFGVIDKAVTDKDEAAKLKAEIQKRFLDSGDKELEARMKVLLAEAGGESWLQRNWRPILMLVIVAIVANNYLIAPYLGAMFGVGLTLPLPQSLWDLMTLGVGGYIAGQTGERIMTTYQQGKVAQAHAASGLYQNVDSKRVTQE